MDDETIYPEQEYDPNAMWLASAAWSFHAVFYWIDWAVNHALGTHHGKRFGRVPGESF